MPEYVYVLAHPLTEEVGYVGITNNLYLRFKAHLEDRSPKNAKVNWIKNLKREGLIPSLRVLECPNTLESAEERERYWIRYYLDQGACLTNTLCTAPQYKHTAPQTTNSQSNETMSVIDIMQKYDVSRMTVYRRIKEGVLIPIASTSLALRRQHKLLFHRKDVEQLLNKEIELASAS